MSKAALRAHLKRVRNQLGAPARAVASRAIVQHLRALPELRAATTVGLFWPLRREVDLRPLLDHAGPIVWALPVVCAPDSPLIFREAAGPLSVGPFGVRAPSSSAEEVPLQDLDLLLMPALGVDSRGQRLGYGGGYYDRTLALRPALPRLAVVFHSQLLDAVPTGPHDLPVHGVVTERGVFRVSASAAL